VREYDVVEKAGGVLVADREALAGSDIAQGPGAVADSGGGVAVGGDVKGSVIVTGDSDVVGGNEQADEGD